MKQVAIFNFRRHAGALVDVLERALAPEIAAAGLKLFATPYAERRRTRKLTVFAVVRLQQLFAEYRRSERRLEDMMRRLAAARDHHVRLGRAIDAWTERLRVAAALNAEAHQPVQPAPERFLEDGSTNPAWLRYWEQGAALSTESEAA